MPLRRVRLPCDAARPSFSPESPLSQERIGELDAESFLLQQNRISGGETVELIADVVNHKQIAVRAVGVTQTQVQAPGILVDGVQLSQHRGGHKSIERITGSAGTHLDIVNLIVQLEAIPLRDGKNAEVRVGMVSATEAKFIQCPVIVGPKAFRYGVDEWLAGIRTPGKLMPVKVIEAHGYDHVLEDVERLGQPLYEVVKKVIVCVGAVVKQGAESGLPLLRLQHVIGIWLIPEKAFKIVFPDRPGLRPGRELEIDKIGDQISTLDKTHLRIEIGLNDRPQNLSLDQITVIGKIGGCRPVIATKRQRT